MCGTRSPSVGPEDAEGLDLLRVRCRRGTGASTFWCLPSRVVDLDLVPAHVAVGGAVLVEDVERAARADGHGADLAAGVRVVHQEAVELRLHAELDADRERPLPAAGLPKSSLPSQSSDCASVSGLQRLRRVLAEHAGGEVADDLALRVLDGDGHVGRAIHGEPDADAVAHLFRRRLHGKARGRPFPGSRITEDHHEECSECRFHDLLILVGKDALAEDHHSQMTSNPTNGG